jgi:mannose-6-phosphate isomerase-like protein (cupin superfamily)
MALHVKRFADAKPYEAANHWDVKGLRLQGFEEGAPKKFWVGLSHFLPSGGAGPDSAPLEKVYVVLSGQMTLWADGQEVVLGPMDSCTIPANLERKITNQANDVCTMLVIVQTPEG